MENESKTAVDDEVVVVTPMERCVLGACSGDLLLVKKGVEEEGVDVNERNKDGQMLLHWAAYGGHTDIIAYLLEQGADIEAQSKRGGLTPFLVACGSNKLDAAQYLLEHGADCFARNKFGSSALHSAASFGGRKEVEFILECGLSVTAVDKDGNTPLHRACFYDNLRAVQCLVQHGADINVHRKDGKTPLLLSSFHHDKRKRLPVIKWLVEHGGDTCTNSEKRDTIYSSLLARYFLNQKMPLLTFVIRKHTRVVSTSLKSLSHTNHYDDDDYDDDDYDYDDDYDD